MTHLPKGPVARTSSGLRKALTGPTSLLSAVAFAATIGACTPVNSEDPGTTTGTGGSKATGGGSGTAQGGSGTAQGGSGASAGGQTGGGTGGSGSGGQSGGTGSGGSSATGGSTGGGGSSATGGTSGGTGGSGPAPTDGGSDVPAAMGGSGCTGVTTAKFCSDFEMQTAGGAPTGDFSSSGAVTVDGAKGFSGMKSLHYKPGGKSQIKFTKQFPMTEQHGRLMMFVAKTPPNDSHWDIVQSNSSAGNIWSWGGMYGKFELVVDPPDDGKDSSTPVPDNKWVCMQWHFSPGTGGKSEYHVKMDGAEVNQSPVLNHWKAGAWKDLAVGFEVFGSAPIEFWIDDLAFGETEIPCPTK